MWARRTGLQRGGDGRNRRFQRGRNDVSPNPWLAGSAALTEARLEAQPAADRAARSPLLLEPQPDVCPSNGDARLPRIAIAPGAEARVWWLGVHGGAGETTLARLLAGSRAAGHAWPIAARTDAPRPVVALVARTHASGLRAAQAAATEWASAAVPVRLLGLVLIADAPGRIPRPLRDLAQLVAGGVPAAWRLPWHEPWRLGEPIEASSAPPAARNFLERITELAPSAPVDHPADMRLDEPHATQPSPQGAARA